MSIIYPKNHRCQMQLIYVDTTSVLKVGKPFSIHVDEYGAFLQTLLALQLTYVHVSTILNLQIIH